MLEQIVTEVILALIKIAGHEVVRQVTLTQYDIAKAEAEALARKRAKFPRKPV